MNITAVHYWFRFYSARAALPEIDTKKYLRKELLPIFYFVAFPIMAPKNTLITLSPFDLPKLIYIGTLN